MPPPKKHYLFGGPTPWSTASWTSTDDRIRGGASTSYLTPIFPASDPNHEHVIFHGTLDTTTLGGAGFASQRTVDEPERSWDLHAYDGVEVEWAQGDGKVYALVLKDELEADRGDGRARSGVNWEVDIRCGAEGGRVWIPWGEFKATYRGREKPGAGALKTEGIRRVGVMMRSFFGEQEGDFRVVLRSICAVRGGGDEEAAAVGGEDGGGGETMDEKSSGEGRRRGTAETRQGWGEWIAGVCVVS